MNKLQNLGIVNEYEATQSYINLGILNISALNSTLNGKVSSSILNHVITKLNSTKFITGVQPLGTNYNLGRIDLSNFTIPTFGTPIYPTISYYLDANNLTNIPAKIPPINPILTFIGPLKGVSNNSSNMTKSEKLSVYKQWYEDTINALKASGNALSVGDYRKAFFCYPGNSPLEEDTNNNNNLTTSVVLCSQLNSTYTSTIQETSDLLNLIRTPEAAASFLKNATNLTTIKSIISNLRSRLGYLSTILSETSASDAVNSQTQLIRELIIALPQNSSSLNTNSVLPSSLKDYMTKYFQWSSKDFAKLQTELFS
uniref:Uncharacterized protein n=1 Tax=Panagrolaimus sp. PS1159 TaxID=55785 RepID=A0AC35F548_9BILA